MLRVDQDVVDPAPAMISATAGSVIVSQAPSAVAPARRRFFSSRLRCEYFYS